MEELAIPKTVEDALSNFALAFSKTVDKNLVFFFKNVLKFSLNEESEQLILSLPEIQNKLIKDEDVLWFISPDAKIPLNIRSLNYLKDQNTIYKVFINDKIYSESKNGNNELDYSVLKNMDSVKINVQMEINKVIDDSYSITLKKRNNLNIIKEFKNELHSHYLNNPFHRTQINNDVLKIESLIDSVDEVGAVNLDFMINRNRKYEFSVETKHKSQEYNGNNKAQGRNASGWSHLLFVSYMGSVGSEMVGFNNLDGSSVTYDDTVFYKSTFIIDSNDKMHPENDPLNSAPNFLKQLSFQSIGFGTVSEFKNIIFKDITDTDNDGIIDFEDNCPETANEDQADTDGDGIGDVCDNDKDGDGLLNTHDNCPETANEDQADMDGDGIGDVCDDDNRWRWIY